MKFFTRKSCTFQSKTLQQAKKEKKRLRIIAHPPVLGGGLLCRVVEPPEVCEDAAEAHHGRIEPDVHGLGMISQSAGLQGSLTRDKTTGGSLEPVSLDSEWY